MRKEKRITISDQDSRDKGKTFLITEMPAARGEAWAYRLLLAVANAGFFVPDDKVAQGMAAVAEAGPAILSKIHYEDLEPLLADMMACVQIVEPNLVRVPTEDDIEEVSTRMILKAEVFKILTGFFTPALRSQMLSIFRKSSS